MGTTHAVGTFTTVCPEISRDTARDLAAFCKGEPLTRQACQRLPRVPVPAGRPGISG
jgi:hypothetical protein